MPLFVPVYLSISSTSAARGGDAQAVISLRALRLCRGSLMKGALLPRTLFALRLRPLDIAGHLARAGVCDLA